MKLKLLFLSQQKLLQQTLERTFNDTPDIEFLPPARDIVEAIHSIHQRQPDVILVDLNPSLFGLRVARELRAACPECRILALASHSDPIVSTQLAFAGVQGFLSKDIGIEELIEAIRKLSKGEDGIYQTSDWRAARLSPAQMRGITTREAQVLELVANGLANKQVAAELGISIKTVEKHRQRLMDKLRAHETAGLSWRAFCMGVGPAVAHRSWAPAEAPRA